MNDLRVQAMFKQGCQKKLSIFIISQNYYEIPKRTVKANGIIYHIFKSNNYTIVRNLYQNRTSMHRRKNEVE